MGDFYHTDNRKKEQDRRQERMRNVQLVGQRESPRRKVMHDEGHLSHGPGDESRRGKNDKLFRNRRKRGFWAALGRLFGTAKVNDADNDWAEDSER